MIDSKKLITSFLVLAIITSSLAFVFSYLISGKTAKTTERNKDTVAARQNLARVPQNAFMEQVPEKTGGLTAKTAETNIVDNLPPIKLSSNLTENFAQYLTRRTLQVTENDIVQTENGDYLIPPTDRDVEEITNNVMGGGEAEETIKFDDALTAGAAVKITDDNSPKNILRYLEAVNNSLNGTLLSGEFEKLKNEGPSAEVAGATELIYGKALSEVGSLEAPSNFADVHKNIVKLMGNRKKIFELPNKYNDDPIRKLIVLQNTSPKIEGVIMKDAEDLRNAVDKIDWQKISAGSNENKNQISRFISSIFAVEKARAIFVPVWDPAVVTAITAGTAAVTAALATQTVADKTLTIAERLLQWAEQFAVEQAKRILMQQIEGRVLSWIEGGGNKRYVTSWGDLFKDIGNQAAGGAIEQIVPGLCSSFGPLIDINLRNSHFGIEATGSSCTLEMIVDNIYDFYNDFSNGGWLAYGSSLLPSGNYFGSQFVGAQEVETVINEKVETARSKVTAGLGFLGAEYCTPREGGAAYRPNQGLCNDGDGEPRVKTPGQTAATALGKAFGSSVDIVANTNGGLVATLLSFAAFLADTILGKMMQNLPGL